MSLRKTLQIYHSHYNDLSGSIDILKYCIFPFSIQDSIHRCAGNGAQEIELNSLLMNSSQKEMACPVFG
jgi:hypothetical protein